jgi:hypothetical protein
VRPQSLTYDRTELDKQSQSNCTSLPCMNPTVICITAVLNFRNALPSRTYNPKWLRRNLNRMSNLSVTSRHLRPKCKKVLHEEHLDLVPAWCELPGYKRTQCLEAFQTLQTSASLNKDQPKSNQSLDRVGLVWVHDMVTGPLQTLAHSMQNYIAARTRKNLTARMSPGSPANPGNRLPGTTRLTHGTGKEANDSKDVGQFLEGILAENPPDLMRCRSTRGA